MKTLLPLSAIFALCLAPTLHSQDLPDSLAQTYRVEQTVTLSEIPSGTKLVKWWISIPDDERHQDVLDFAVTSAPGKWSVVREPDHGNRFMVVEVPAPKTDTLSAKVEFTLRRQSVFVALDPAKAGPITDSHRQLFADDLRLDAPHMEVTDDIVKMATKACGAETNIAIQSRQLLDAVADFANHYSIDATKPKCSIGDAGDCMTNAGGCCTDMHSLFISLARSRGIPARLQMGYRLREQNEGKEVDPGYRCWAEYFVPGYGWIPADVVEADDPGGLGRDRWFSGLTDRRLWLNQGRDFKLPGSRSSDRVSTMVIGHAEIDGVVARTLEDEGTGIPAQLSRVVRYTEVKPPAKVATAATH
jgi:transglutaminase-like putative cysteine protease